MTDPSDSSADNVAEHLQKLGLTEYQSRAYIAVVELANAPLPEIVEESGVPQARIYDVIDDLSDMGLIEIHEQSGGKTVSAPSPEDALESYRNHHVSEFTDTIEFVSRELERSHKRERTAEGSVTVLTHKRSATRHMRRTIEEAEWWLSLSLGLDQYEELESEIRDALDRGVTVRLIIATSEADDGVDTEQFPGALRVRTRQISDILAAADRTYGVYSGWLPTSDERAYHVVTDRNLVLQFQHYYEQIWTSSRSVTEDDSFPRRYLDPWRAIVDLQSEIYNGDDLEARIVGYERESKIGGSWSGRVVDYELDGPIEADYTVSLPVRATLVIDTGEESITVGGWKAQVEDVAAEGLEISRMK